jgi:alpha-glucosidase
MDRPGAAATPWWRRAAVYQIYIRSFADSDGDGTGDVNGLRTRLSYLSRLGIDAIWVNPWYQSPLVDGGYDVTDYRSIDPRYGTLDETGLLISEAHDLGIKVLADLVPNHTSDQHAWFREAIASPIGHPSRDRFHIRDGRGPSGDEPPNGWRSVFGGPAWRRLPDGQWYLHLFAAEQPDLNWCNPDVRDEFDDVLRFWLDRGIDGFRVDVAHGLVKDPTYPDLGEEEEEGEILGTPHSANHPYWDRDDLHEIVRRWRSVLEEYPGDRMMVAEAWVHASRLPLYLRPDEYHQSFNFDFLLAQWGATTLSEVITSSLEGAAAVDSTPTWVLSNHDVMRVATRYGLPPGTNWRTWSVDGSQDALRPELGSRRARAGALLMLALPGSAYLYQGDELGLPEVWDLPEEALDDPAWKRSGHALRGRDGCRVPIPWETSGPSAGFGSGPPWLPQPEGWGDLSVEAQEGVETSTLELHRAALTLRRRWCTGDEELTWLVSDDDVLAFRRQSGLACVVNLGDAPVALPPHDEVLLCSDPGFDGALLAPDAAIWLRQRPH